MSVCGRPFGSIDGGLVIVEAKPWRNPDARRSAVAQAMEYASALFRMSYSQLEAAVLAARRGKDTEAVSLFEIVPRAVGGGDEPEFVDALALNLSRGRAVIALVGDGIREDIQPLAQLLQSHAGHRFTFALVELAIYATPIDGVRMVFPSVLAQTAMIERGVIRFAGDLKSLTVDVPTEATTNGAPRAMSISDDAFYEALGARDAAAPALLKAFVAKLEDRLGFRHETLRSLNLKRASRERNPLNLGSVTRDGYVDTGPATWFGRSHLGEPYNNTIAAAIGGSVSPRTDKPESAVRTADRRTPRLTDLLPAHEDAWLAAIEHYVAAYDAEAPKHVGEV